MKKICKIIIFIVIVILSEKINASTITYNLEIDENMKFHEKIIYNVSETNKNKNEYDFLTSVVNDDIYFDLNETIYYKKQQEEKGTLKTVTLTHNYSSLFLGKSRIIKECFADYDYDRTANSLKFSSSGTFFCSHRADEITINITTPLRVTKNNAEKHNGNTYTWENIDKEFELNFEIKPKAVESTNHANDVDLEDKIDEITINNDIATKNNSIIKYILIAIPIVLIIIVILFIILKIKSAKNNEI